MKTTIGILQSGANERIENMASEFFGVVIEKTDRNKNTIWLTFPSKKTAQEFSQIINFQCVDIDKKIFQ